MYAPRVTKKGYLQGGTRTSFYRTPFSIFEGFSRTVEYKYFNVFERERFRKQQVISKCFTLSELYSVCMYTYLYLNVSEADKEVAAIVVGPLEVPIEELNRNLYLSNNVETIQYFLSENNNKNNNNNMLFLYLNYYSISQIFITASKMSVRTITREVLINSLNIMIKRNGEINFLSN